MKKIFTLLVFISIIFAPNYIISKADSSNQYYARSYILIDGYSGEVLQGYNYNLARSVASISKIMTAIIAIESERLFYSYTIPEEATNIEGSSIYLQAGDNYRLIDLVYGLLLRSGNDAAYAISLFVSGSTADFVNLMNEKAIFLGLKNTIYHNPCGLDIEDEGNISSAYDMAILMKYCMDNGLFREIVQTRRYQFSNHVYLNKNKLLSSYKYYLGGKTGYTSKAKRTLISASMKDGQYLIACTLDCGSDYSFHRQLFDSYYENYNYLIFLNKGKNNIDEYVFYSEIVIGMRIRKEISGRGIKKYFINPITNSLKISFIDSNLKEHYGGEYNNVYLETNL